MAELGGPRVYCCCNCRNQVCLHDDIVSKAFQLSLSQILWNCLAYMLLRNEKPVTYIVQPNNLVSLLKRVDSLLQHPDCCGWLYLPFDDRVSRRLHDLNTYRCTDKLVVVGPNTSYVEPDGKELFLKFGIPAYPFTKKTVLENEIARLREVSLQDWLRDCGIHSLLKCTTNEILPVSHLQDSDVLVFFGSISSGKLSWDWDGHLFEWVSEMKTATKRRLEVIFLCLHGYESPKTEDAFSAFNLCNVREWLLPAPYDNDLNTSLFDSLMFDGGFGSDTLVAFGPNGRLLRLGVERSLKGQSKPATFPESDDVLPTDVRDQLHRYFKSTDEYTVYLNLPWR